MSFQGSGGEVLVAIVCAAMSRAALLLPWRRAALRSRNTITTAPTLRGRRSRRAHRQPDSLDYRGKTRWTRPQSDQLEWHHLLCVYREISIASGWRLAGLWQQTRCTDLHSCERSLRGWRLDQSMEHEGIGYTPITCRPNKKLIFNLNSFMDSHDENEFEPTSASRCILH